MPANSLILFWRRKKKRNWASQWLEERKQQQQQQKSAFDKSLNYRWFKFEFWWKAALGFQLKRVWTSKTLQILRMHRTGMKWIGLAERHECKRVFASMLHKLAIQYELVKHCHLELECVIIAFSLQIHETEEKWKRNHNLLCDVCARCARALFCCLSFSIFIFVLLFFCKFQFIFSLHIFLFTLVDCVYVWEGVVRNFTSRGAYNARYMHTHGT